MTRKLFALLLALLLPLGALAETATPAPASETRAVAGAVGEANALQHLHAAPTLLRRVRVMLAEDHGITHCTVQIEQGVDDCIDECG